MIYRIPQKKADGEHLTKSLNETLVSDRANVSHPYSDAIVKKPWGYEYMVFENEFVAIWILQIIRKRKTSMHCHPNKKTGLILLSGNATTYHLGGALELNPLDCIVIERGAFHATEASSSLPMIPHSENGIWVMEIESPPIKTDLLRLKDEYGRAGASYEGVNNMIFEPRECLKFQTPKPAKVLYKTYHDCLFTLRKGAFGKNDKLPKPDALISVIACDPASG